MLPAHRQGRVPGTVDVMLNCQLPSTFEPDDGGGYLPLPTLRMLLWLLLVPPSPQPHRRTSADSPNMLTQRFIDVSPADTLGHVIALVSCNAPYRRMPCFAVSFACRAGYNSGS